MRILGDIPHPRYKITILEMSSKITIQIEDGMLSQSYRFRDGAAVTNVASAIEFCDEIFLHKIDSVFTQMQGNMIQASERISNSNEQFQQFI